MKKKIVTALSCMALIAATATLLSAAPQSDEVMTKENGMYVINTTTLGKNVTGYVSTTPLKIYIKKNKVVKIEALKNQETPKYFVKVKKEMLDKWNGKKVNEALQMKVDGVTGATFSSDAVKQNVMLGLEYYKKHK
jgi:electron transport complex protein RnfG